MFVSNNEPTIAGYCGIILVRYTSCNFRDCELSAILVFKTNVSFSLQGDWSPSTFHLNASTGVSSVCSVRFDQVFGSWSLTSASRSGVGDCDMRDCFRDISGVSMSEGINTGIAMIDIPLAGVKKIDDFRHHLLVSSDLKIFRSDGVCNYHDGSTQNGNTTCSPKGYSNIVFILA